MLLLLIYLRYIGCTHLFRTDDLFSDTPLLTVCGRSLTGPVSSETFTEPLWLTVVLTAREGKVGEGALKLRKLPRTHAPALCGGAHLYCLTKYERQIDGTVRFAVSLKERYELQWEADGFVFAWQLSVVGRSVYVTEKTSTQTNFKNRVLN